MSSGYKVLVLLALLFSCHAYSFWSKSSSKEENKYHMTIVQPPNEIVNDDDYDRVQRYCASYIPKMREYVLEELRVKEAQREAVRAEWIAADEKISHACIEGTGQCGQAQQEMNQVICLHVLRAQQLYNISENIASIDGAEARAKNLLAAYDARKKEEYANNSKKLDGSDGNGEENVEQQSNPVNSIQELDALADTK